ncbi:hypothetical protein ABIB38_001782 [Massilia sp. UYP11]|uniref:hypothetical protein n=1 Tax=Massilia sp. UYP11 TaxID=1756385 RepID=UPI003D1D11AD
MKNPHKLVVALSTVAILSACSNPNSTPEGTVKDFYAAAESADLEKFTSHLGGSLKEQVLAKKNDVEKSLQEGKLKISKCGGIKTLTSSYPVVEGATTTEGNTLVEYKGECPKEKQYLKLAKHEKAWLISEAGPSVKVSR